MLRDRKKLCLHSICLQMLCKSKFASFAALSITSRNMQPDICISMPRIFSAGPIAMDASSLQLGASISGSSTSSNERANQLGLIIGIVCGALLAVTLVSVAVFWTVCWKQQKERLARKIQLHVLYQQQRMQQQVRKSTCLIS